MNEIYCHKDGKTYTLKKRLIENTEKLMKAQLEYDLSYAPLIDYIRGLFQEIYDLDIFQFTDTEITDKFCKKHYRCRKTQL